LPAPDTGADLALLASSVREAGKIARTFFGGSYKRWSKAQGSPVTEADLAVDRFLNEQLRAARPAYGWLSEETDDDPARLDDATVFVVDPIDGTVAFMKNRPHFTICAAVVHQGRSVAGVVYNPISDEFFAAREGHGATRNGDSIRVSGRTEIEGCRMLGDKAMFAHRAWEYPMAKHAHRNQELDRLPHGPRGSRRIRRDACPLRQARLGSGGCRHRTERGRRHCNRTRRFESAV
jgi:myo-inositol-1(or 4)-monophosphatase